MVDFIGDIISDFVADLMGWIFKKLPKPVRLGCLSILGLMIVGVIVWVWVLR